MKTTKEIIVKNEELGAFYDEITKREYLDKKWFSVEEILTLIDEQILIYQQAKRNLADKRSKELFNDIMEKGLHAKISALEDFKNQIKRRSL